MSTARIYTTWAKIMGYTVWAANQALWCGKNVARSLTDSLDNSKRYSIELMIGGATIKTADNLTTKELCKLLENMSDYGISEVIIHEMKEK